MKCELAVPLALSQIEAAIRLQHHLSGETPSERALYLLREQLREWDLESCLVKSAALNQLYFTNVKPFMRTVRHVHRVMSQTTEGLQEYELVGRLALLPTSEDGQKPWKLFSFASKFAHFFIDSERFPIYDSFAEKMLAYHLGPNACLRNSLNPYQAFVMNFNNVRMRADLTCTTRELDKYLWLAGLYRQWKANPAKPRINVDAERLFVNASGEITRELERMIA